jgi:ATP-dependent Lon protease
MEIIDIPGYGENEKLAIANQFLVPKELIANGLSEAKVRFTDDALRHIIRYWTMESGVRGLEREIARCIRRVARQAVSAGYGGAGYGSTGGMSVQEKAPPEYAAAQAEKIEKIIVTKPVGAFKKTIKSDGLEKLLGRRKYKNDVVFHEARVGISCGLAWTETGGALLPVESTLFNGNGEVLITGNLGDVMKESARIALSYLRSVQEHYAFTVRDVGKTDFHIHVPEGAIPKDGPSAGIAIAASLLSTLCRKPLRPGIAMTGELTLTGRVLPIGGLKGKLLAAIRNRMEKVLLPAENLSEWDELDKDIRAAITVAFIENAADAFALLFTQSIVRKK